MGIITTDSEFSIVYQSYYKRIYNVSWQIIKDSYLAEDIVQETFIKAYKNLDRLKENDKIGAWLATIATRTAIDVLRKEKRRSFIPLDEVIFTDGENLMSLLVVDKEMEKMMKREEINQEVILLSSKLRKVFLLKYQNELKDEEIANQLNISISAVKTRIYRAKKIVQQQLQMKEASEIEDMEVISA